MTKKKDDLDDLDDLFPSAAQLLEQPDTYRMGGLTSVAPKMDVKSRIMYFKEFLKSEPGKLIAEIITNYKNECIAHRVARTETARKRSDFTESLVEDVVLYAHYEEAADDLLARIQNCVIVEE